MIKAHCHKAELSELKEGNVNAKLNLVVEGSPEESVEAWGLPGQRIRLRVHDPKDPEGKSWPDKKVHSASVHKAEIKVLATKDKKGGARVISLVVYGLRRLQELCGSDVDMERLQEDLPFKDE